MVPSPSEPPVIEALRAGLALFDLERPGSAPERVVVIAHERAGNVAQIVAGHFPSADVQLLTGTTLSQRSPELVPPRVAVDAFASTDDLCLRIIEQPAPQLVINTSRCASALSASRLPMMMFALADGGSYLETGRPAGVTRIKDDDDPFAAELTRLMSLGGRATTTDESMDLRCGTVVSTVSKQGRVLLIGKSGDHYAKLDDRETTPVLTRRYGTSWGRELEVRAPESFRSKAEVRANIEAPEQRFPTELHVPPMYLREYFDAICAPRQLVVSGRFVVPASFHHASDSRRGNVTIRSMNGRFAELDANLERAPLLPGTYFHLDSEYPSHFGHVFSEDISKLWGWDIAKRRYPELRILRSTSKPISARRPAPVLVQALGAYGIAETEIVCIHRPVRVERLVTASQQFHNGVVLYVSEQLSDTWDRLREGLRSRSGLHFDKIFVTRPDGQMRSCLNGALLEKTFARYGFEIVRPELLPLAEQAELFASARVIAGYGGSAMINSIYSEHPGTRIVIASDTYPARNEFLISAVKGDDFHYYSCPSRPLLGRKEMHSDFEFDFARDGEALEQLLAT